MSASVTERLGLQGAMALLFLGADGLVVLVWIVGSKGSSSMVGCLMGFCGQSSNTSSRVACRTGILGQEDPTDSPRNESSMLARERLESKPLLVVAFMTFLSFYFPWFSRFVSQKACSNDFMFTQLGRCSRDFLALDVVLSLVDFCDCEGYRHGDTWIRG